MKSRLLPMLLMGLVLVLTLQSSAAHEPLHARRGAVPACEPGFQMVEETTYQNVERIVCKMVPEVKKKSVYDWIDDPFCILDSHHGGCPNCAGPFCRKKLVKKQVDVPCPTMKCVTEKIVEQVPCVIYKKVPCSATIPAPHPARFQAPSQSIEVIPMPADPKKK
jgi:hypothetical protein